MNPVSPGFGGAPRRRRWWWAGAVLLVLALGAAGVAWKKRQAPAPASAPAAAARVMEVAQADLETVRREAFGRLVPLSGSLRPAEWTVVKSKVAGELSVLTVREGERVARGAVLARFDDRDLQARVAERGAVLEAARAQLALARKNQASSAELLATGFISRNAYDTVASNLAVAEANLRAAEAQLEVTRKALADAVVLSPMAGIVAERYARPGEKLPVDARLMWLVDLSRLELEAEVPAADIAALLPGQAVEFTVEGFEGRAFQGTVARINPAADERSRTLKVYVLLPNPDEALKGGMFAKGTLRLSVGREAVVVPQAALREENGEAVAWVLEGDTVARRAVKLGARDPGRGVVEVLDGLKPGERMLRASITNVAPGARVRLVGAP
ncbi:MAG: efflux RND transporter periplasmic adaptor subunit [Rhodocyclaceae bacterium]|jgi:RND family efflux transporter MFP subunit|nr:efflux RND transporter periplasmic adaptor subunit [Rhodocyclaceae bacterium]MCA3134439.1 efflux RND transporter periplasmic adaptor subunit [Rhodocyclaceae bacterium]MCA3144996.1 efflux RND transporter periplasmic adaptor subunit [Rhodocyclaceae bacterium]